MQLDLRNYKASLPGIKNLLESNVRHDPLDIIGNIAVATHCPIVVVCYYVAHLSGGMTPELQSKIDNLVSFYNYDSIIGIEDFIDA